jgi:hypothetical protein
VDSVPTTRQVSPQRPGPGRLEDVEPRPRPDREPDAEGHRVEAHVLAPPRRRCELRDVGRRRGEEDHLPEGPDDHREHDSPVAGQERERPEPDRATAPSPPRAPGPGSSERSGRSGRTSRNTISSVLMVKISPEDLSGASPAARPSRPASPPSCWKNTRMTGRRHRMSVSEVAGRRFAPSEGRAVAWASTGLHRRGRRRAPPRRRSMSPRPPRTASGRSAPRGSRRGRPTLIPG